MKLLALFLAGFAAGVAASWMYIASMKATVKLYKAYIHARIDAMGKDDQNDEAVTTTMALEKQAGMTVGPPAHLPHKGP